MVHPDLEVPACDTMWKDMFLRKVTADLEQGTYFPHI